MNIRQKNILLSTLIVLLIFGVMCQIWLLYVSLNNVMQGITEVAWPISIASVILLGLSLLALCLLPPDN